MFFGQTTVEEVQGLQPPRAAPSTKDGASPGMDLFGPPELHPPTLASVGQSVMVVSFGPFQTIMGEREKFIGPEREGARGKISP